MDSRSSSASIGKYSAGDDPKDIDWLVYAKTDKYYVKKFEAETNITGYLVMDLSQSMGYTYRQELTKFDYAICLAAALCYLMVHQQDPVGLDHVRRTDARQFCRPSRNARSWGPCWPISRAASRRKDRYRPEPAAGRRDVAAPQSGDDLFSDLLADLEPVLQALRRLRHRGHDVILFHILDEAEATFPFDGAIEFEDPESETRVTVDAAQQKADYLASVAAFRDAYRRECLRTGVDYVALDTSMQFDKALLEYLLSRRARG